MVYTLTFPDIYDLAETASIEAMSLNKIAVVCEEKYLEGGKFYETVSQNRGLRLLVTSDHGSAIHWLS